MEELRRAGERIRQHREALHMSQRELAGKVFVTQSCVSSWERQRSSPTMKDIGRVAVALRVPVLLLLGASLDDILGGLNALIGESIPREQWAADLAEAVGRRMCGDAERRLHLSTNDVPFYR